MFRMNGHSVLLTALKIFIIVAIAVMNLLVQLAAAEFHMGDYYRYTVITSLLFVLLGFCLSDKPMDLFTKKININMKRFSIGLLLFIIGVIPVLTWTYLLNYGSVLTGFSILNLFRTILQSIYANHAICVGSGFTLASALIPVEQSRKP